MRVARLYLQSLSFIAAAVALAPLEARAQSYAVTQTSASFSSIASSGTVVGIAGEDDYAAVITAPFSFPFFGSTVSSGTSLHLNTNGTLNIGASDVSYANTTFPSSVTPNGFLAPFWMDLTFANGGEAYYRNTGAELIVEWSLVQAYNNSAETMSFQVRIATDGTIRYVYGPNTSGGGWDGASIGLEDVSGTLGASASCTPTCQPTDVPSGTTIVFTPGATPTTPDLSVRTATPPPGSTLQPGATYQVAFEVANLGAATSGPTRIGLFAGLSTPVTTSDAELATVSVPALAAGGAHAGGISLSIPAGTPAGTLSAALIVDPDGVVAEAQEGNNAYPIGTYSIGGGSAGAITITTAELPAATVGITYDVQLQQVGGTSPTWALIEGGLPSGLTLSSSGRIVGTPSESGSFYLAVEAFESGVDGDVAELELFVSDGGTGGLTVSPSSLPQARVGVPYSASFSAAGGTAPYAFQVIVGRPDWMMVSSDGTISGTPTAAGQHSLTVSVFDSQSVSGTAVVALAVIESGPLEIISQIPAGVAGRDYRQAVVRGGTPPYAYEFIDGQLPSGMALDPSGTLVGVPPSTGTWQITVRVTDSAEGVATGQFVLRATEFQALAITTSELTVNLRTDASVALEAAGGVPPYTWSIAQGALQTGLGLDPAGFVVGRVEEASTATVTFAVRDVDGQTDTRQMLVLARGYRNTDGEQDSRSGRGGRSGGCVCLGPPMSGATAWWGALGLLLALGRGRRRRSK